MSAALAAGNWVTGVVAPFVAARTRIRPRLASSFKPAPTSPNAWKLRARSATVSVPWITMRSERTRDDSLCARRASSWLPASVLTGISLGFIVGPLLRDRFQTTAPAAGRQRAAAPHATILRAIFGAVTAVTAPAPA